MYEDCTFHDWTCSVDVDGYIPACKNGLNISFSSLEALKMLIVPAVGEGLDLDLFPGLHHILPCNRFLRGCEMKLWAVAWG